MTVAATLWIVRGETRCRVPDHVFRPEGAVLDEWLVMGPFRGEEAFETDFIAPLGKTENAIDSRGFAELASSRFSRARRPSPEELRALRSRPGEFVDLQFEFQRGYDHDTMPQHAAYLACNVIAREAAEAYIALGSQDGPKLWVNGKLVHAKKGARKLNTYDDCVRVELRPGANFLLLKISRVGGGVTNSWGASARIDTSLEAATASALAAQESIQGWVLGRSIVAEDQAIPIDVRGAPTGGAVAVSVFDRSGRILQTTTARNQIDDIRVHAPPGLYRVEVEAGRSTRSSEDFIIGDPDRLGAEILGMERPQDEAAEIQFETLQHRFDILCLPKNRPSPAASWESRREWERKLVYTIRELANLRAVVENGQSPTRARVGLHMRGYRSIIDDQVHHYRLYVPSTYATDAAPLPLAVFLPTTLQNPWPFIESPFAAGHTSAERLSYMAEQLGMALVWVGYRQPPANVPPSADFTHVDEVLRAIGSDYNVDARRVYLFAICGGARAAGFFMGHWPRRFAAVALIHPQVDVANPSGRNALSASQAEWGGSGIFDPFGGLAGARHTPLRVIWDGSPRGHGDIEESLKLVEARRAAGSPVEYSTKIHDEWERMGTFATALKWLSTHRREEASDAIDPAVVGPIAAALGERFVLVIGTGGTEGERAANARLAKEFQAVWRVSNFGPCRWANDVDIADDDHSGENLVLIGNPRTNSVWRRFAPALPLSLGRDEVRVYDHVEPGRDLAVQAVFEVGPSGRKIVTIGAEDIRAVAGMPLTIHRDGWFEYALWKPTHEGMRLVRAGLRQNDMVKMPDRAALRTSE